MVRGREGAAWQRDSLIMSLLWQLYRCQFLKKNRPKALGPDDFNPFAERNGDDPRGREADSELAFDAMKAMFAKRKKQKC
jgi:hypothetical protein